MTTPPADLGPRYSSVIEYEVDTQVITAMDTLKPKVVITSLTKVITETYPVDGGEQTTTTRMLVQGWRNTVDKDEP